MSTLTDYKINPLLCVITGMEHSGTTLCSQLLNGHPEVAAGVECGLLLSNIHDFNDVQPFWEWLLGFDSWNWGLTESDRDKILLATSYQEAYLHLANCKGRAHTIDALRNVFVNSPIIYDKTPRYVYTLDELIEKVDRPFLITFKSPDEALSGHLKRTQKRELFNDFINRYKRAVSQIVSAKKNFPQRVLIVRYQSLAQSHQEVMSKICEFLDFPSPVPLNLDNYNKRYGRHIVSRNSFIKSKVEYVKPILDLNWNQNRKLKKMINIINQDLIYIDKNSI